MFYSSLYKKDEIVVRLILHSREDIWAVEKKQNNYYNYSCGTFEARQNVYLNNFVVNINVVVCLFVYFLLSLVRFKNLSNILNLIFFQNKFKSFILFRL